MHRPDLSLLRPPPGWTDLPARHAPAEYRKLLKTPQGADPALEVRLDLRSRPLLPGGRLRIKALGGPEKPLLRHGWTLETVRDDMQTFYGLLQDALTRQPDSTEPHWWLDNLVEYDLLLQVHLWIPDREEQPAGLTKDLDHHLTVLHRLAKPEL